jgi:hypothetical protein
MKKRAPFENGNADLFATLVVDGPKVVSCSAIDQPHTRRAREHGP